MKIHLFPKEIATQIILLVLLSTVIFHLCIGAAFLIGRHYPSPHATTPENLFIFHIADFIKIANAQPAAVRDRMLDWLATTNPQLGLERQLLPQNVETAHQTDRLIENIQSHIGTGIGVSRLKPNDGPDRIAFQFEDGASLSLEAPNEFDAGYPREPRSRNTGGMQRYEDPGPSIGALVFGSLLFIAISFTIFLVWAVRGVMRPLRGFAMNVDAFAVDGTMTLLEENGPSELRSAARALNRMRERVKAMIEQRTQMLAAISHDLRTPITRLRLRAEFIELSDIREPILRDIEQMNAMVHSALSYIRDGVEVQRNTLLDLSALLQTACDEFTDMGYRVTYEAAVPVSIHGNGDELYRAVNNLVSNAVRFGSQVDIRLRQAKDAVEIDVIDDGPGIPEEQKTAMLAPFTRGDSSRPVENLQGFGLGLPIVQAIVNAHRGLLTLLDRQPHGLVVRITLPCTELAR